MDIVIIALILLVGIGFGVSLAYKKVPLPTSPKTKRKQRILELLETQQQIQNNDVESLLGVADSTATRYLQELENEGKIKQVGSTGRSVFYEKI